MESHNQAVRVYQVASGGGDGVAQLVSCAAILDPTMLVVVTNSGIRMGRSVAEPDPVGS